MVNQGTEAGRRALLDFIADELRLGLGSAPGMDSATRSELLGLVDDLVELATGGAQTMAGEPGEPTPFDPIYLSVER
jgi:hypothetical protein